MITMSEREMHRLGVLERVNSGHFHCLRGRLAPRDLGKVLHPKEP
jgi:hypothetical protein